jgi:exopolysaccharide biosynthesis polyprenyl glycosylphosphotransferase
MKKISLTFVLIIGDIAILVGTFLLAYFLRFSIRFLPERPAPPFELYFQISFLIALVGFAMLHSSGMYRIRRISFEIEDFFALFRAATFSLLIIMVMNFAFKGIITRDDLETYSRLILLISWVLNLIFLSLWRFGVSAFLHRLQRKGIGLRRVIIVGTDEVGRGFFRAIQGNAAFGYRPLGFVTNGVPIIETEIEGLSVFGEVEDIPKILRVEKVDEVVLACIDMQREVITGLIAACERMDVRFSMIPGFLEILTRQMNVQEIAGVPIFQLEERVSQRWGRFVKRGMDVGLALGILIFLTPLLIIVAVGIKLSSRGPVFYRQARVGRGERIINIFKFRSMYLDAEEKRKDLEAENQEDDPLLRIPQDPRVTSLGKFLRRFSIDEIPQVFNVLKGEMSLVGPRPHIPAEVARYKKWQLRKYDCLPGITGLTQVSGRKDLSLDEMVRLDIFYMENWSPLLDLKILIKTIPAMLFGRGAY